MLWIHISVLEDDDDFDEFKSAHGVTIDPSHASATHELETDSFPRHSIGSRLANHHLSQPRIGVGVPKPLLSPFKKEEERENSSEEFSEFQRCTSVPLDSRVTSIPKDPHRDGLNGISTLNIGALDEGVITQQSSPREPVQPPPAGKESLNVSASSGDLLGDSLVEDKYSVLRNLDVVSNIQNQNIRNVPNPASDEDEFGDFLSGVIHSNILPSTECGSSNSVPPDILPYEWTNASPFSPPKLDSEGSQSEFADFQVNGSTTHCVTQNSANESESRPPFLLPSSGNVPWPAMIFESSFGEGKTELPKRPTDSDDEFGDFITTTDFCDLQNTTNRKEGDSISLTSNFFKSKDIISIESQSVSSLDLGIEHSIQSKSSEEAIHDINRHGSVPSLDLKINVEFEDESEVIGMSNLTLTTDHMKPYVTAEPSSVSAKGKDDIHYCLVDTNYPS